MTPLGLGNDLGGSLRWPAQCCGISSLKPTLGRIPHATTIEPVDLPIGIQLIVVEGPMARRVADLRAAFEVMAGPSWRDPWTVPAPLRGPEPAKPVRVALVADPGGQGTAKQVQDGVRKAATALEDAGYAVDEVEAPSTDAAAKTWLDILTPDWRAGLQMWGADTNPPWGADTNRFVSAMLELAPDPDPLTTIQCFMVRQSLLRARGEFQEEHPLIVAPIFTDVPFEVGTDLTTTGVAEIVRGMRMALAVSALGLPAVALPVGTGDGLPQSVQVIGPRYREDLCLDAAAALEDRLGIITPIDPR
jgi:amidase